MKRINVVYLLITDESKSKILMVYNKDNHSWSLPGGTVEGNETLEEAAVREAKEETGFDIRVSGIVAVNEAKLSKYEVHAIFFTYRAEITAGELELSRPEEISDIQWMDSDQANKMLYYYKDQLVNMMKQGAEIPYFNQGTV